VRLRLNKKVSGMAHRLIKTLKGTGITKIELCTEDGTMFDSVHEEDETELSEAPLNETSAETTSAPPAETASAPPAASTSAPADTAHAEAEPHAIREALATAIREIEAATGLDPVRLAEAKKLVAEAAAALKAADDASATAAIGEIRALLSTHPGSGPAISSAAPMHMSFTSMQKSRLIWDSTRKHVMAEIESLKHAVRTAFDGDPDQAEILATVDQADEILANLDERLLDMLDAMLNEADSARRATMTVQAKALIDEYVAFAQSNELLRNLEGETPFGVKLTVASTMTTSLKALQSTLH